MMACLLVVLLVVQMEVLMADPWAVQMVDDLVALWDFSTAVPLVDQLVV